MTCTFEVCYDLVKRGAGPKSISMQTTAHIDSNSVAYNAAQRDDKLSSSFIAKEIMRVNLIRFFNLVCINHAKINGASKLDSVVIKAKDSDSGKTATVIETINFNFEEQERSLVAISSLVSFVRNIGYDSVFDFPFSELKGNVNEQIAEIQKYRVVGSRIDFNRSFYDLINSKEAAGREGIISKLFKNLF